MTDSTRKKILDTIRSQGRVSVNELAEAAGISPVSVRHHLSSLAADQLIKAEEKRQGVGRPRKLYSLTERAIDETPGRYLRLTNRILDRMKTNLSNSGMEDLFSDIASSMASELEPRIRNTALDERLTILSEFLTEEGFSVEIEKKGSTITVHEFTCPYLFISREHPEVCSISKTLISQTLGVPAQRQEWLMRGDGHCSFVMDLGEELSPPPETTQTELSLEQLEG